ncbi:MAG: glycoside hydrolase family 43 protein [Planctomycetia bacterium]|nr:glycoside hydrolase family 43 protein [Planctomycetia bacterium]
MHRFARRAAARTALVSVAVATAAAAAMLAAPAASAYPGAPWFEPGKPYAQNFPDPSVIKEGGTYYAYATPTGGAYLPVETSTDLNTWTARPAYDPGPPLNSDPYFNDALPQPAAWGADVNSGRMSKELWGPGIARIGGRYLDFYAIRIPGARPRFCISVATATGPLGPFRDTTTRPFVCDPDPAGSIDPAPYVDPAGHPWLLWKSEGVPGSTPTRIWSRQLTPNGMAFAAGSSRHLLLQTALGWEGNVIENPSMIHYGGTYWLFYSANEWASSHYATGYATCSSPAGPCRRGSTVPLLHSSATRLGPGGASALIDPAGHLALAYDYWNAPYTNYPAYPACADSNTCQTQGQRRLGIARLRIVGPGRLAVS